MQCECILRMLQTYWKAVKIICSKLFHTYRMNHCWFVPFVILCSLMHVCRIAFSKHFFHIRFVGRLCTVKCRCKLLFLALPPSFSLRLFFLCLSPHIIAYSSVGFRRCLSPFAIAIVMTFGSCSNVASLLFCARHANDVDYVHKTKEFCGTHFKCRSAYQMVTHILMPMHIFYLHRSSFTLIQNDFS